MLFLAQAKSQNATNKTDTLGRKQGHWIKLDDDKKKMYEGDFVDNIPVGKFIYYYDNGTPWAISVFSKKGTVAYSEMFDASGTLSGEGKYINEKKDSLWKFYNHEGNLLSEENYTNGIKNGLSKVYYTNGKLVVIRNFKNGLLEGPCKKYFNNGQIKFEGNYINDKLVGHVKFYFSNGKVYTEGLYVNDLKDGTWKYYKKDGTVERTDQYINGRLQGADPNVISKEQEEKEKQQFEEFEIKDPYQEGYTPTK